MFSEWKLIACILMKRFFLLTLKKKHSTMAFFNENLLPAVWVHLYLTVFLCVRYLSNFKNAGEHLKL